MLERNPRGDVRPLAHMDDCCCPRCIAWRENLPPPEPVVAVSAKGERDLYAEIKQ